MRDATGNWLLDFTQRVSAQISSHCDLIVGSFLVLGLSVLSQMFESSPGALEERFRAN